MNLASPSRIWLRTTRLDIAIDGADQIAANGWLIKGGGAAHLREKIVAAAAERFVVIADSSKPVKELRAPVPLELFTFGLGSTLARLGDEIELRQLPPSPDRARSPITAARSSGRQLLAARLEADPGVAAHGLFPADMVSDILIGSGDGSNQVAAKPEESAAPTRAKSRQ